MDKFIEAGMAPFESLIMTLSNIEKSEDLLHRIINGRLEGISKVLLQTTELIPSKLLKPYASKLEYILADYCSILFLDSPCGFH